MWIGIITVIFILVFIWFCPLHWKLIGLAACIIIFGTALSLLFENWKESNWRKWGQAVFIGIILTVGALISTYAWDLKSEEAQKKNLIKSLAQELAINRRWLNENLQDQPSDIRKLSRSTIPTFSLPRITVLNAVVSSGLLDMDRPKEKRLFWAIVECERSLRTASDVLQIMNEDIIDAGPIESRFSVAKLNQQKMLESEWFIDSKKYLRNIDKLLEDEYESIKDIPEDSVKN